MVTRRVRQILGDTQIFLGRLYAGMSQGPLDLVQSGAAFMGKFGECSAEVIGCKFRLADLFTVQLYNAPNLGLETTASDFIPLAG